MQLTNNALNAYNALNALNRPNIHNVLNVLNASNTPNPSTHIIKPTLHRIRLSSSIRDCDATLELLPRDVYNRIGKGKAYSSRDKAFKNYKTHRLYHIGKTKVVIGSIPSIYNRKTGRFSGNYMPRIIMNIWFKNKQDLETLDEIFPFMKISYIEYSVLLIDENIEDIKRYLYIPRCHAVDYASRYYRTRGDRKRGIIYLVPDKRVKKEFHGRVTKIEQVYNGRDLGTIFYKKSSVFLSELLEDIRFERAFPFRFVDIKMRRVRSKTVKYKYKRVFEDKMCDLETAIKTSIKKYEVKWFENSKLVY